MLKSVVSGRRRFEQDWLAVWSNGANREVRVEMRDLYGCRALQSAHEELIHKPALGGLAVSANDCKPMTQRDLQRHADPGATRQNVGLSWARDHQQCHPRQKTFPGGAELRSDPPAQKRHHRLLVRIGQRHVAAHKLEQVR